MPIPLDPPNPVKPTCPKCGSPVDVTHQTDNRRLGDGVAATTTQTATCTNDGCDYAEHTTVN